MFAIGHSFIRNSDEIGKINLKCVNLKFYCEKLRPSRLTYNLLEWRTKNIYELEFFICLANRINPTQPEKIFIFWQNLFMRSQGIFPFQSFHRLSFPLRTTREILIVFAEHFHTFLINKIQRNENQRQICLYIPVLLAVASPQRRSILEVIRSLCCNFSIIDRSVVRCNIAPAHRALIDCKWICIDIISTGRTLSELLSNINNNNNKANISG